jgi:multidrug efflux pump subunit AcrA (membrane-fusion protein)
VSVAQANIVAPEGATAGALAAEGLSERGGAVRWRHYPAQRYVGALVLADATSGTFLFALMHSDTLRIQLYVPQDEAFGVAPGVDAVVRVPEMPGREFPGKVTRIADALQPGTRTLLTEIDVPNPDHVSLGVYCTVELKIPRKTPSLIVPSEAIAFNRDGLNVVVVEDRVAHIRQVNVVVEVNSGVKDGDQVILNPPVDLTDGHTWSLSAKGRRTTR